MNIVLITKIRNERDIIRFFLGHIDKLFDTIYLLDHQSNDGTNLILRNYSNTRDKCKLIKLDFSGHFHKEVSNYFLKKAFEEDNADYVFFLDADEFIDISSRKNLELRLGILEKRNLPGLMLWKNCIIDNFNTGLINSNTKIWIPNNRSQTGKIIISKNFYNSSKKIDISQGNHAVEVKGRIIEPVYITDLFHLPFRSKQQTEIKIILKSLAYLAIKNRNPINGWHNFEILQKISEGGMTDDFYRGLIRFYETDEVSDELTMQDMNNKYTLSSFSNTNIIYSKIDNYDEKNIDVGFTEIIAKALINWEFEDISNSTFFLSNDVLSLKRKVNIFTNIGNLKKIKSTFVYCIKSIEYFSDIRLINKSNLFDKQWYEEMYPDVKKNHINPILHYILYGAYENRDPSPNFKTSEYKTKIGDLNINPLIHYIKKEKRENGL